MCGEAVWIERRCCTPSANCKLTLSSQHMKICLCNESLAHGKAVALSYRQLQLRQRGRPIRLIAKGFSNPDASKREV